MAKPNRGYARDGEASETTLSTLLGLIETKEKELRKEAKRLEDMIKEIDKSIAEEEKTIAAIDAEIKKIQKEADEIAASVAALELK